MWKQGDPEAGSVHSGKRRGPDLRCSSRDGGRLSGLESILEIEDRTC